MLSSLAVTPADAALLPAEPEHVISLNGTWRFKLEQPGNVKSPQDPLNVLPPSPLPQPSSRSIPPTTRKEPAGTI